MRVLLDECVNPRVKEAFPNHEIQTVKSMGWAGITNGKLIALAQQNFDVFVTVDQNLEHQQNLTKLALGLIVVTVPDNNIRYFRPIFPQLLNAVESVRPGQVIQVVSPEVQN
jgi:predicted nuclease of predicted toxin-antitoxin system